MPWRISWYFVKLDILWIDVSLPIFWSALFPGKLLVIFQNSGNKSSKYCCFSKMSQIPSYFKYTFLYTQYVGASTPYVKPLEPVFAIPNDAKFIKLKQYIYQIFSKSSVDSQVPPSVCASNLGKYFSFSILFWNYNFKNEKLRKIHTKILMIITRTNNT